MTDVPNGSHVLVATDFSEHSTAAYAAAAEMARNLGTGVRVVHVADARSRLQEADPDGWTRDVGLERESLVELQGVPWLEILRYSEALAARVVVVGTKGQADSSIQVPGSTTLALLRYSRVPVMVVPLPAEP